MKQTFELKNMGVVPISEFEMQEIDGGGLLKKILRGVGVTWFADQIISNWDEIKQGFKEGWNSVHFSGK